MSDFYAKLIYEALLEIKVQLCKIANNQQKGEKVNVGKTN